MTSNIHWMIAAAGADAQQTRQAGFSCVHFCSRLSEEGTFSLTALPAGSRGDYLGIADSRGFAAALCLGAIGVQVGTCLLVSEECPIHENYKNAVIKAKDTDTVVTGRSLNSPVRILKNPMSRQYIKLEAEAASRDELEKLTLGGLRRAVFEGDMKTGSVMMGQIAGLCKEIRPLKDILDSLVSDIPSVLAHAEQALEESR